MDKHRYVALLLDLRRFLELARREYHGEFEPDGTLYRKACEAVDELERAAEAKY